MRRLVKVLWDDQSLTQAETRRTKNALYFKTDEGSRWVTWPDRFTRLSICGMSVWQCRYCDEYYPNCECEVVWP